ncbi:hypothetical protein [Rhizobium leguminosarum]|uniref:hypothetical protein n=1 Tax=Rhizobium TaxID=379 RepID=UPI0010303540|nr:hypothetical protein [Rhizobium leguminosarum]TBH13950.1 hypothetical protein ELG68_23710 [Rhizobium leguminosarum]
MSDQLETSEGKEKNEHRKDLPLMDFDRPFDEETEPEKEPEHEGATPPLPDPPSVEELFRSMNPDGSLVEYGQAEFSYELNKSISLLHTREASRVIARYVLLSLSLQSAQNAQYYNLACIGLRCAREGHTELAHTVWEELYFRLSTSAALGEVLKGMMRFVLFVSGFLLLGLGLWLMPHGPIDSLIDFATSASNLMVAVLFGFLGSIVSILLRLSEFEAMVGRSRQFLRYTGMTLPIIGGTFAAVIAALFESKVINMSLGNTAENAALNPNLFILIGFLCGFSERFARGILTDVESKFTSQRPPGQTGSGTTP